ncbi:YggS family pyridoxal phosphate-dependent enzyme [Glaciecola sp. MH2013]|uniref:YggS family pyridoxal phosphate-dependent enzyme n=1 Tax=Glaciecola sp. MH2013 TaxID=2785524 RepID=UPI00189CDEEA|nr:YggS family pyridoxal phosphate-dependent enzyme [Glaciecola sp. MH2013]MBF7071996.1 YggS family pyridoxal phosphate-dependent enzyme [Glaciecola sp. MH2013]
MTNQIADNIDTVKAQIKACAKQAGRDENNIELLAVSKTKPVSDIVLAYEAGHRNFGENYVQEGVDKITELKHLPDIIWHFIGPLQSNKTRLVAENFDWMHSVDRYKIAKRLNDQRPAFAAPLNICVQINIDEEETKTGILPQNLMPMLAQLTSLSKLRVRGLMAIPKSTKVPSEQIASLRKMQTLFEAAKQSYPEFDTLSIGMSNDLASAITCGSTMVRVGTAIFGARD